MAVWKLQISTFVGILAYAQHYMGYLKPPDKRENPNIIGGKYGYPPQPIEVESILTKERAKALSTDDFTYKAGTESGRYFTRAEVIEAAKAQFLKLAEPGDELIGWLDDLTDDPETEGFDEEKVILRKEA
jgi:hypothetical protein